MTDRKLLELAAKAAGLNLKPMEIKNVSEIGDDRFIGYMTAPEEWVRGWFNPLTDDADAFRLAVKLEMDIEITIDPSNDAKWVWVYLRRHALTESCGNDPYAATRRAIVRAAAEIGRGME
jgi:hypothetical protein